MANGKSKRELVTIYPKISYEKMVIIMVSKFTYLEKHIIRNPGNI